MKRHPSSLAWFRFQAGDLAAGDWLAFRAHALRCPTCRERLRRERLEQTGVETSLDERRPGHPSREVRRRWLAWASVAVAPMVAAAAGLVLHSRVEHDELRPKGGSRFDVFVDTPSGPTLLTDRCRPRDALQAEYSSDRAYLLVIGVDPENRARTLVPLDGWESTPIVDHRQLAPNSWILDMQPGRERFVAFFSDAPIASSRAQAAAVLDRPSLDRAAVVVRECVKEVP